MPSEVANLNFDDPPSLLSVPFSIMTQFFISRLTWSFAVPILLILAYILGKKTIQQTVIIDNSLKERLENVEISKKNLKKYIEFWETAINFFNTILLTTLGLIFSYTLIYYFKPEYVDFLISCMNKIFIHVMILLIVFIGLMLKYTKYKRAACLQSLNEIDQENMELAARIVSKMGPELKKLLTLSLIATKKDKNALPECKKELCQIQKRIYELDLMRHKIFVERVATFSWCSACSNSFYFQQKEKELNEPETPQNKKLDEMMKTKEDLKEKEISQINQLNNNQDKFLSEKKQQAQKEKEIKCLDHCVKRYFSFAIEIGNEFKQNLDEINFLKKKLEEIQKRKNK
jgi:hypothetical protein